MVAPVIATPAPDRRAAPVGATGAPQPRVANAPACIGNPRFGYDVGVTGRRVGRPLTVTTDPRITPRGIASQLPPCHRPSPRRPRPGKVVDRCQ